MTKTTPQDSLKENIAWTADMCRKFPKGNTLMHAIRRKCIDCTAGEMAEITNCELSNCALWPFRSSDDPFPRRNRG